jgi:beta-aspartyl-dipeptidase (metallo-type)
MASILLLKNATVYSPKKIGKNDVLCIEGKISKIGSIDITSLDALGLPYEVIEAEGLSLTPGFIDPHEHLIGGSGEKGFNARTPEITIPELIRGGITTVVGCLGVDTYTRTMEGLLAQARYFNEEGLSAFIWTGGYPIPPTTLTESVITDMMLVHEVIGAGEIAVSDLRSSQSTPLEIAKLLAHTYNGGILSGKCGVTHFHMGDGKKHLEPLAEALKEYDVKAECIYPTHVNRNPELLKQGAALTKQKVTVDFDICDEDLVPSIQSFIDHGGDLEYLTVSSDASFASPETIHWQLQKVHKELGWPLEKILPLVTTNTARMLKMPNKGRIEVGADADILLLNSESLEILHVIGKGKIFMRNKEVTYSQDCLKYSNRKIETYGKKTLS